MEPQAATAGAAGTEMAAPEPQLEPDRGSPVPGRCAYFVERKKRFCKMTPGPGRRFCGEHGQHEVPAWPGGAAGLPEAREDGLLGTGSPGGTPGGDTPGAWRRLSAWAGPQHGQGRHRLRPPLGPGCAEAAGSAQQERCHCITGLFF